MYSLINYCLQIHNILFVSVNETELDETGLDENGLDEKRLDNRIRNKSN